MPYIAESAETLGTPSLQRRVEVAADRLCQVCGEPTFDGFDEAFAVMSTDSSTWVAEWPLDHGLLHEECLRLALRYCPDLRRWHHRRLLRVTPAHVELTEDYQMSIATSLHAHLEVDIAEFQTTSDGA